MEGSDWTKAVTEAWDALADLYDAAAETDADYYRTVVMGPGLLRVLGTIAGRRVLDLGCGQGYFSRQLARAGARVVGVDISTGQIAHAREHEAELPLGIVYHALDAARIGEVWGPSSFDLVVSCIALQDMPDPSRVLAGAKQVLVPEGRAVMLVSHPMNDTAYRQWERAAAGRKIALRVDRYFETGPRQVAWTVNAGGARHSAEFPSWTRTLEEWSAAIAGGGFVIAGLYEPRPSAEEVARIPDLDDCSRIPYFLIFDLIPDPRGRRAAPPGQPPAPGP